MKKLKIAGNKIIFLDDEDYDWVKRTNWYLAENKQVRSCGNQPLEHRILRIDPTRTRTICFKDGNPKNLTKSNLELITATDRRGRYLKQMTWCGKPCSSKYKGVCWDKSRNRWIVFIEQKGKQIYLGRFENEEDAAKAHDKAAIKYFGQPVHLNFPKEEHT